MQGRSGMASCPQHVALHRASADVLAHQVLRDGWSHQVAKTVETLDAHQVQPAARSSVLASGTFVACAPPPRLLRRGSRKERPCSSGTRAYPCEVFIRNTCSSEVLASLELESLPAYEQKCSYAENMTFNP